MMPDLMNELGVPRELQAYFDLTENYFEYDTDREVYSKDGHFVPVTQNLWLAGNAAAKEIVITHSAMEGIAFLTLNAYRYNPISRLSFLAIGNLPCTEQLNWIRKNCQKRKITLAFGNDLLGCVNDVFVATAIAGKSVSMRWAGDKVLINFRDRIFSIASECISLNSFEKLTGTRTGIRTAKPKFHDTWLQQLQYDNKT